MTPGRMGLLLISSLWAGGCAAAVIAADATVPATVSLSAKQASELVSDAKGVIALDSLENLSPDVALRLAMHDRGLSLDRLSSLDAATARALALHGRLSGVEPNALDTDAVLAKLERLFADEGDRDRNLDGIRDGIESLLADLPKRADGDQDDGVDAGESDPWLSLGGLKTLSPEVASVLALHDGPLLLDGLADIPPDVARGLARHAGELSLAGLTSLSDEAREALATHEGPVVLPDALLTVSSGK